ncbi:hypothetical protein [Blastococcus sp. CCUG 61487]|nr:hypothetical protein [Blastococcus sp. CCUG 61487]
MEITQHAHQRDTVRRYLSIGFWLVAAAGAAALGLDVDGDVLV